jgi:pimeloyl-ACP methyl ester carboxylesterase
LKRFDSSLLSVRTIAVLASLFFARAVFAGDVVVDGVPIPEDAKIAPTGQDINESNRRFLGAWAGTWAGDHRHVLIVEEVRGGGDARVIYAVADYPPNRTPAAWSRHEARIADRTLTVTAPTFTTTYELMPSDALKAAGQRGGVRGNGKLWRADLGTLMLGRASIPWTALKREFLDTSMREDDKTVRLEVILFQPSNSGPFPLFVFNHGSTGSGRHPELFTETRWNFAIANFFMEKGWLVAFPQRRGRGKSDGQYDEGFATNRAEGYTCDPTRSLAGADRALDDIESAIAALQQRPDVIRAPILIGGVSRGGILSTADAGKHPDQITAVINFVGGWVGEGCATAREINGSLFRRGATFQGQTLWLYGRDDVYYSVAHSRSNFEEFRHSGGQGTFLRFEVPGANGRALTAYPDLWAPPVDDFLRLLR